MGQWILLALALVAGAVALDESETFMGWKDFKLNLEREGDVQAILEFIKSKDAFLAASNPKDWPEDVLVRPENTMDFQAMLRKRRIFYTIEVEDAGKSIRKERKDNMEAKERARRRSSTTGEAMDASTYFAKHSEINDWIDSLASSHSDIATVQTIGYSYERRTMKVLKLSAGSERKTVFIDAAIHAREWLAPATLNYIVKQLITDYKSGNSEVKALFDKYNFFFLPIVNPDGYDYTFRSSSTRFWRKTRQPYGFYYGADPNRNFDDNHCGAGTSNSASSDVYCGPRPFSEPETLALSNYLTTLKYHLALYISFHTYGQLWLTPPGYTRVNPPDHQEIMRVGNIAAAAIRSVNGNSWKVGQPYNVGLYEAAGGSYDWVRNKLGVKYSFTPELKPQWPAGINGFLANVRDIPPSGKEIYAAVKAVAKALP